MNRTVFAILAFPFVGCAHVTPPRIAPPTPDYVSVPGATTQQVWDAAVDLLVDAGSDYNITPEIRVLTFTAMAVAMPSAGARRTESAQYADCGTGPQGSLIGTGALFFNITTRVRDDGKGGGLLKVVASKVWQEAPDKAIDRCVSKGVFELELERRVLERVTPAIRR